LIHDGNGAAVRSPRGPVATPPIAARNSREKQREQKPDGLDGLDRAEVDSRGAAARAAAEDEQQHRQGQRANERQVRQFANGGPIQIDERDRAEEREADEYALGIAGKEQRVANRIGPAEHHGEPDTDQQLHGREQDPIAGHTSPAPQQRDDMKGEDHSERPPDHRRPEIAHRSNGQERLERREVRRRDQ
jgi:hypothetical protein